jgi:succinylglutamic semialdehyde dehydrogenase
LTAHQDSMAKIISEEVGKPLWDAGAEVHAMIGKFALALSAVRGRRSPSEVSMPWGRAATRYKPHGVLAVYGPFNFPGHIANGQIVPALLAGNTVLFKPSELTPRVAEETVKLWQAANLPRGVLNLIQGGRETGEILASHDGLDGILFTGSLKTGIALRRTLLEKPEKLLALELGGNNPLVIHNTQDMRAAVYWTIQSAYITSGQRCTCARRLVVTDGNDDFVEMLIAAVRTIAVGPPDADPQPFLGPLIHSPAAQRVLDEQKRLIQGGAQVLVEAKQLDFGPAFLSPGLIDVTNCRTRDDCEVFGPLLQLVRVRDLQQAIAEANHTQYGLVASLFSEDRDAFETSYDGVRAGLINWNRPTTGGSGQLPFGGVGRSGNHRPAGYFTADFCDIPIASLEADHLTVPAQLSPGVQLP